MSRAMSPMNSVGRPDRYEDVRPLSDGVPIVLSIWHAEPARATVVFLPGTMVHPLFYAEFLDGLSAAGTGWSGCTARGTA
jgi:alpha-beta hydrolase superfamily lysophospholipase